MNVEVRRWRIIRKKEMRIITASKED